MSTCSTCRPLDCQTLVNDDTQLYSLQREIFPLLISCPPGVNCDNASGVSIKCCETILSVTFATGATAAQRLTQIERMISQCALISAACVDGQDVEDGDPQDPTAPPPAGPPPPPPPDNPTIQLYYNRTKQFTRECANGGQYTFYVKAGSWLGATQEIADQAAALAAYKGSLQYGFCLQWTADMCADVATSNTIITTGGQGPFTWTLGGGSVPTGMTLTFGTGNNARLTGTPTVVGPWSFVLNVRDAKGGLLVSTVSGDITGFTVTTSSTPDSGSGDGTATATPDQAGSYTWSWDTSPEQTTEDATGLVGGTSPVGDYLVTVTDTVGGCVVEKLVHVAGEGCFPVTDVTIYTGGLTNPDPASWFVIGGTLAQVGNDVQATGSITQINAISPVIPADGVFNLAPIGGCLEVFGVVNFTTDYTDYGYTPVLTVLDFTNGGPGGYLQTFVANPAQTPALQYLLVNTDQVTSMDCTGLSELLQIAGTEDGFNLFQFTTLVITGCVKLASIQLSNNALNQASVDAMLIFLRDFGPTIVNVNVSGGITDPPSVAGAAAKAALILRGGTVVTN